ncbi:MAG: serine/threonine-protein kinase, partial [Planctomycetota bacterium]
MSNVDEQARRRFESDWLSGSPKPIGGYLSEVKDEDWLATLEELVCIDMEFRWSGQAASDPPHLIERYLQEFPPLSDPVVLQRLINQEVLVRAERYPMAAPQANEYERRFPGLKVPSSTFGRILGSRDTLPLDGKTPRSGVCSGTSWTDDEIPRQAGSYDLLHVLGHGGMGTVYRARHRSTGREVAWKVANIGILPANLRKEARSRVLQEIRLSAKLSHDHLVPVHDIGEIDGQPFYTMPVVDTDLGTEVRQSPLDGKVAADYVAQAARGVHAAHQAGLLHRDIKPHNLMLDRARDRVLVTDFGLARCMEDPRELTMTGQVLGTPPYMPPEQIRNAKNIDERADVYSLGASLYHLLTGRPPFVASESAETLRLVLDEDPLPPRQQNTTVDLDLDTICIKCLHKEPALRYASASDLADDLERYLDGQPIHARQLSSLGRLTRWQRRSPGLAKLSGALAMALVLLAVVSLIGWVTTKNLLGQTRSLLTRVIDNNRQGQAVVDELFDFVRTEPMLRQPGGEAVHREILERGLRHYEELSELAQENQSLLAEQFAARVAIGLLTLELDGPEPARNELQHAIELHHGLSAAQQSSPRSQLALGDAF